MLVLGAGASAPGVVAKLRPGAVKVIAINLSFRLLDWADVLYAADAGFWATYPDARQFDGWRFCADEHVRYIDAGVRPVIIPRDPRTGLRQANMLRGPVGTIGNGGNSGFQAVNLAAQFGARRVLLCLDYSGKHWHPDHPRTLRNPDSRQLGQWARDLDSQAPLLAKWGVEVVSVAKHSILKAYPYADSILFDQDGGALPA